MEKLAEETDGELAKFGKKTQHRIWFSSPILCGQKITILPKLPVLWQTMTEKDVDFFANMVLFCVTFC